MTSVSPRRLTHGLTILGLILFGGRDGALSGSLEQEQLTVQLEGPTAAVLIGEPVVLRAIIANKSATPANAHSSMNPDSGYIAVSISDGRGTREYSAPGWGAVDEESHTVTLQPGEQRVSQARLLFNVAGGREAGGAARSYLAFPSAGEFSVELQVLDLNGSPLVTSTRIQIIVVEPAGVDALVWAQIDTVEAARLLHTRNQRAQTPVVALFQRLIADYPNSRYTPFLRQAIGQ
jgi:hypothetical protein